MSGREMPEVARLLRGVEYNVYQATGSLPKIVWHAHVAGLRPGDLAGEGLYLRAASISAEGIAYAIERKAADLVENHGRSYQQALREILDSYASRYRITPNGLDRADWTDVGDCSTRDEARDRACAVIGYVLGRRLARATAGYTPEPVPVPPILAGAFA